MIDIINLKNYDSTLSVLKNVGRIGFLAVCIFAISMPIIYYNCNITKIQAIQASENAFIAKSIETIVQARPEMWEFEATRLEELVMEPSLNRQNNERKITNSRGEIIAKNSIVAPYPTVEVTSPFHDSGTLVGYVISNHSIKGLIIKTVFLGFFGCLLGFCTYFIFRNYPVRMLYKVFADLQYEKEKYEKTVQAICDGVILTNYKNEIQLINHAAELLIGLDAKEAKGRQLKDVYKLHHNVENKDGWKIYNVLTNKKGQQYVIKEYRTRIEETETGKESTVIIFRDISHRDENEEIQKYNKLSIERLRKTLGATVQAIASIVEARDPYTSGHQRKVADLARSIATLMGLNPDQIEGIRTAARIHDIGKIAVPAEILSKPTKLKNTELELIKEHPIAGYEILKDIDFPWPVARMVLEHHETVNGSGYPRGLTGDEMLVESKIIAVADVVEAIASHRPYRPALGIDIALDEIENNKGVLYDADVVNACLKLFREDGYILSC